MRGLPLLLALAAIAALSAACTAARVDSPDQSDALSTKDAGVDGAADGGADVFVDPRDGHAYPTVTIGEQTWLARNLDVVVAGSYCYDDDPASCERDGRLYTWKAAPTACPAGWRLGTDEDWKALEVAAGMADDQLDLEGYDTVRGTNEGTTLKSKSGFAATMAGFRADPSYYARDDRTYFWTATTRGTEVWRRRVTAADSTVFRFTNPPQGFAISVRCVMSP
jgi:uncharacterized protein (TIGR02145 family)